VFGIKADISEFKGLKWSVKRRHGFLYPTRPWEQLCLLHSTLSKQTLINILKQLQPLAYLKTACQSSVYISPRGKAIACRSVCRKDYDDDDDDVGVVIDFVSVNA